MEGVRQYEDSHRHARVHVTSGRCLSWVWEDGLAVLAVPQHVQYVACTVDGQSDGSTGTAGSKMDTWVAVSGEGMLLGDKQHVWLWSFVGLCHATRCADRMLHRAVLCHAVLGCAMPCCVLIGCCIVLCRVMLCAERMLCRAVACRAVCCRCLPPSSVPAATLV
jgi:hypothetical protein